MSVLIRLYDYNENENDSAVKITNFEGFDILKKNFDVISNFSIDVGFISTALYLYDVSRW